MREERAKILEIFLANGDSCLFVWGREVCQKRENELLSEGEPKGRRGGDEKKRGGGELLSGRGDKKGVKRGVVAKEIAR